MLSNSGKSLVRMAILSIENVEMMCYNMSSFERI